MSKFDGHATWHTRCKGARGHQLFSSLDRSRDLRVAERDANEFQGLSTYFTDANSSPVYCILFSVGYSHLLTSP